MATLFDVVYAAATLRILLREFTFGHTKLEKFLEHRIADKRVPRLIRKWLSAGVIEDGNWSQTMEGAPQGASASPLRANV